MKKKGKRKMEIDMKIGEKKKGKPSVVLYIYPRTVEISLRGWFSAGDGQPRPRFKPDWMQSYLALRYFRMIGRCGRHDYLTIAAAATHASHLRATAHPRSSFPAPSRSSSHSPMYTSRSHLVRLYARITDVSMCVYDYEWLHNTTLLSCLWIYIHRIAREDRFWYLSRSS